MDFETKLAAVEDEAQRALLCREELFCLVFERHPYAGGVIVDRILNINHHSSSLLRLIKDEKQLIEYENIIIKEGSEDPAIRQLVEQENAIPLPAIRDSAA